MGYRYLSSKPLLLLMWLWMQIVAMVLMVGLHCKNIGGEDFLVGLPWSMLAVEVLWLLAIPWTLLACS